MSFNYYAYLYFIPNKKIMKTRRTKFLLSFLAVAILWFAMVNAYTFEVTNRDPFGTLNLSTLMIKPNAGNDNETMLLSGTTLRIKTDQGKLKVHKICNEKAWAEESCLDFDEIWNGGGGSWITATWTIEDYCYLLSDGNLRCDDDTLMSKIAAIEAFMNSYTPWEGATVTATGENTGFYCSSTNWRELVCNNKITSVPWEGVTVSVTGTTTGYYCSSTGDWKTLVCNNPITGWSWITATGTSTWLYCKLLDDWNLLCDWDPNNWWEWGLIWNTASWGYCMYSCMNKSDYESLSEDGKEQFGWLWSPRVKEQWDLVCVIDCTNTSVWGSVWWVNDNIWWVNSTIYPKLGRNVSIWNGTSRTPYSLYVRWDTALEPDNKPTLYKNLPDFKVTQSGIAVFWWITYWITGADWLIRRSLSVHWPIIAWNNSNHISMYADWDFGDNERHFEIMGSNELAIWTQYWAFLYFTQKTWNYIYHIEPLMYWWNPDTYWWWDGCIAPKPDWDDGSTIIKDDLETPISPKGTCTAASSAQLVQAYPLQEYWDFIDAYETLMVWVNTNQPNATLDVYGSLRIGNNCVPAKCDTEHAWTMMYYETSDGWHLVICSLGIDNSLQDRGYHRYEINKTFYETSAWAPWWYTESCYAPVPSPHPIPHPQPYEISEEVTELNDPAQW